MSARKKPPPGKGHDSRLSPIPDQISAMRSLIRIARELHTKADHDLSIADQVLADIAAQLMRAANAAR